MKRGFILVMLFALLSLGAAACKQQEGVSATALTPQAATLQALQTAVADLQSTVTVLLVAAADAAAEGEGEGKSENVPVVMPTATPPPVPLPTATATLTRATTLQGATGVLFSVNRVTWEDRVEGFYPLNGHRWLVLHLTLSNPLGNPPVDYDPLWFSLVDVRGKTCLPAPIPGVLFNARMFTLLPGDTVSGRLAFAVPTASPADGLTLVVQDDPLSFQPPLQVQLDVPPMPTPAVQPTEEGGEG